MGSFERQNHRPKQSGSGEGDEMRLLQPQSKENILAARIFDAEHRIAQYRQALHHAEEVLSELSQKTKIDAEPERYQADAFEENQRASERALHSRKMADDVRQEWQLHHGALLELIQETQDELRALRAEQSDDWPN